MIKQRTHTKKSGSTPKPVLVVVAGRSGAGKSTTARLMARRLHAKIFTTDQIRRTKQFRVLAAPYQKIGKLFPAWLRRKFYRELMRLAREQLKRGHSVILDATFSEPWMFQMANHLAIGNGVRMVAIEVIIKKLNERKIMQRLVRRVKRDKGAAPPKTFWAYPTRRYLPARVVVIQNDGTIALLRKRVNRLFSRITS